MSTANKKALYIGNERLWVVVTKAAFVDFSVKEIFYYA